MFVLLLQLPAAVIQGMLILIIAAIVIGILYLVFRGSSKTVTSQFTGQFSIKPPAFMYVGDTAQVKYDTKYAGRPQSGVSVTFELNGTHQGAQFDDGSFSKTVVSDSLGEANVVVVGFQKGFSSLTVTIKDGAGNSVMDSDIPMIEVDEHH